MIIRSLVLRYAHFRFPIFGFLLLAFSVCLAAGLGLCVLNTLACFVWQSQIDSGLCTSKSTIESKLRKKEEDQVWQGQEETEEVRVVVVGSLLLRTT